MSSLQNNKPGDEINDCDRRNHESDFWSNVPEDHSSCGIGFVAMREANRRAVDLAMQGLLGMKDRTGEAFGVGDGAGLIFETDSSRQLWESMLPNGRRVEKQDSLSAGMFFFEPELGMDPRSPKKRVEAIMKQQGIIVHGWRSVPVNEGVLPGHIKSQTPSCWQLLYSSKPGVPKHIYDQQLFYAQQRIEREIKGAYPVSLNSATITYKAKATPRQFKDFYPDLMDPRLVTGRIGFHARMGTNTAVTWPNVQPFRKLLHNGELVSDPAQSSAQANLERSLGVTAEGQDCVTVSRGRSDTGHFDGVVQVLMAHGVPAPEALRRRMLPGPHTDWRYSEGVQNFHEDVRLTQGPLAVGQGPAAVIAVTGKRVSAIMDGSGLRTFWVYGNDDVVIGSSEIGAPPLPMEELQFVQRLSGGDVIAVEGGKLLSPEATMQRMARKTGLKIRGNRELIRLNNKPEAMLLSVSERLSKETLVKLWNKVGGEQHVMEVVESMVRGGKEPIVGMGDDRPLAILSAATLRVAEYFNQMVGVVTNPPVDSLREGSSMDTRDMLGRAPKQDDVENPNIYEASPQFAVDSPFLNSAQFAELLKGDEEHADRPKHIVIDTTFEGESGEDMEKKLDEIIERVVALADSESEAPIIVFSDKGAQAGGSLFVPPVFLASGIHQVLRARGLRDNVKLVFDTADALESHDMALLISQGADAVHPYLLWEMAASGEVAKDVEAKTRLGNLQKALNEMLKVIMSKYGVTSINAYRGSCFFEILGLDSRISQKYFPYNVSRISGLNFDDLVKDQISRSAEFAKSGKFRKVSESSARRGKIMKNLNDILLGKDIKTAEDAYKVLVEYIEKQRDPVFLRDLLGFVWAGEGERGGAAELELGEVESVASIICRHFRGSHMSDGALSPVAHAAIAVAINELAAELMPQLGDSSAVGFSKRLDSRPKSGSGEGGEDKSRYPGGDFEEACSKAKQIASGRFGVDAEYLMSVGDDGELQIKIGQGAKPGEGGHVKGEKIDKRLAAQRGTQPGVELISPPTQHDIYSIEDLMRLVWDLRAVHPNVKTISVKVTTKAGIGTIAVGVAKSGADKIVLSGREGGTGAAKSSATRHTGSSLDLGVIEAFRSLQKAGMVDKIRMEGDGGIITGSDVVKLAIMGVDEFGFGTSLLQAGEGCVFCNCCSDGSAETGCPVGICIQDPEGIARLGFGGKAQKFLDNGGSPLKFEEQLFKCKNAIKHYWNLVAGDVQQILAKLGVKTLEELRGRTDLLKRLDKNHRSDRVDLGFVWSERLADEEVPNFGDLPIAPKQAINEINERMINAAKAYNGEGPLEMGIELPGVAAEGTLNAESTLRTIGGTLAGLIASKQVKVPEGGFRFKFKGYPGQSFGFCMVEGMNMELEGIGRDFIASAMSGGKVVVKPPQHLQEEEAIDLVGASCAYGARGGKLFVAGTAGQRFGVRSCGATLVCEGVGDFAFEYMTGGTGVVLGDVGGDLGSGMAAGEIFVWNENAEVQSRMNASVKIVPMTEADEVKLQALVVEHFESTGSPKAKKILGNWDRMKSGFVKVISKYEPKPKDISEKGRKQLDVMQGDFPVKVG